MLLNHRAINWALSWNVDYVHQGTLYTKYGRKAHKTRDISTIDKATGLKWVPKCPGETPLVGILGFWRDHVVLELLETKN